MNVIDAWVTIWDKNTAQHFGRDQDLVEVQRFFGKEQDTGLTTGDELVAAMDAAGIDGAILGGPLQLSRFERSTDDIVMQACERHPERLRGSYIIDPLQSLRRSCDAIEAASHHELVAAIRILPMLSSEPIGSRLYYPVYERCEGLGLPVTVNVGVPGPRYRARYQDPLDLDDVCIDFPDLTVIATHMGHPWEGLLVRLMMKYEHLYLCNSAYLAEYMDPVVIGFMDSKRGRDRLIFASDEPFIPMARALQAARGLNISSEAMENFLAANALRAFRWTEGSRRPNR